jgi:hypothetical protein
MDLVRLKDAIKEGNEAFVQQWFARLDRQTGNERFQQAGEQLGFRTNEADGVRYALGREMGALFYGSRPEIMSQLLKRWGRPLIPKRSLEYGTQQQLKQLFALQEGDNSPTFATYEHFLLAGLQGKTPMAREVQVYLLSVEQQSRVKEAVEEETGFTPRQLANGMSPEVQALLQMTANLAQSTQAMLGQTASLQQSVSQHDQALDAIQRDIARLKEEQPGPDAGKFSALGFSRRLGRRKTDRQINILGQRSKWRARKEGREQEIDVLPDARWGFVNAYPEDILVKAWNDIWPEDGVEDTP